MEMHISRDEFGILGGNAGLGDHFVPWLKTFRLMEVWQRLLCMLPVRIGGSFGDYVEFKTSG